MRGRMAGMTQLSSAIIALAGAVTIAAGGIWKGQTGDFATFVGYGLLIAGTATWGVSIYRGDEPK